MIKHPNIIKLKCVVKSKQDVMLVLELIEGGQDVELFEEIKRLHTNKDQFNYNLRWIKQTFVEIALTVKYLHDKNITHRDLKPENILFKTITDRDGRRRRIPVIIDFALAVVSTGRSQLLTTPCGTRSYMAPEIYNGHYTTKTIDVYRKLKN